jgi:hypothetical protein
MPATSRFLGFPTVVMGVVFLGWNLAAGMVHADSIGTTAPSITVTATPSSFVIGPGGSISATLSGTDANPPQSATPVWKYNADSPGSVVDNVFTAVLSSPGNYSVPVYAQVSYDGGATWSTAGVNTVSVTVVSVAFSADPVNVAVGGTATLTATVTPPDAASYVSFSTADGSIATVSGNASSLALTGVGGGQTQLQAMVNGAVCATATVNSATVTVTFSPDPIYVGVSGLMTMTATVTPPDAATSVSFSTGDATIATVTGDPTNLLVLGLSSGQTQLQATVNGNICGSTTVNVVSVTYSPDPLAVGVGNTVSLSVTVNPPSAAPYVSFATGDPTIAVVFGGAPDLTVTGLLGGTTTVDATVSGTAAGSGTINAIPSCVATFSPDPISLIPGDTGSVTVTATPSYQGSQLTFDTDDSSVATVIGSYPDLTVVAIAPGITSIRAWLGTELCGEGKAQVVNVDKVQYKHPQAGFIDVPNPLYVLKGTKITFKALKTPAAAAWPNGKPVWGGTGGATGNGEQTDVTFGANGDKTVTAECGNTVTVNIKVGDIVVTFDKPEVRPGTAANRKAKVKATATRQGGGAEVTINLSTDNARATVAPATITLANGSNSQDADLTVTGVNLSAADRDTNLLAKVGGNTVGSIPITVVEPKNWTNNALVNPVVDGAPTAINDGGKWKVQWKMNVVFTVQDQFQKPLQAQWAGVLIYEGAGGMWVGFDKANPANGTAIDANAQATDPVYYINPNAGVAENIAKGIADGSIDPGWKDAVVSSPTISYKIVDGGTTYNLEKTNAREVSRAKVGKIINARCKDKKQ